MFCTHSREGEILDFKELETSVGFMKKHLPLLCGPQEPAVIYHNGSNGIISVFSTGL